MAVLLPVEVLAWVAGVLLLRRLVPACRSRSTTLVTGLAVLGAAVFWVNLAPRMVGLVRDHERDTRLTRRQALDLPGRELGARADVLAWADRMLPRRARVYLQCPQPASCPNPLANWIAYRLEPRVFTDYPWQARWILFYRSEPSSLKLAGLRPVASFAPGYELARVHR